MRGTHCRGCCRRRVVLQAAHRAWHARPCRWCSLPWAVQEAAGSTGCRPCVTLRAVHSAGGALLLNVHSAGRRGCRMQVVRSTSAAQCCRWSMSLQAVQGAKGGAWCCEQCAVLQQRTAPRAACDAPGDAQCRRCTVLQVAHGTGSAGHKAAGCEVLLVVQGAAQAVRGAGSGQCRMQAVRVQSSAGRCRQCTRQAVNRAAARECWRRHRAPWAPSREGRAGRCRQGGAGRSTQGVTQQAAPRAGGPLLKAELLPLRTAQPDFKARRVHVLSHSRTPFASSVAEEHPPSP